MTNEQPYKPHRYCLVLKVPGDSVITYSRMPFGAFHVGDEVSLHSYAQPRPGHSVEPIRGGKVVDVIREVAEETSEILDTTWVEVGYVSGLHGM